MVFRKIPLVFTIVLGIGFGLQSLAREIVVYKQQLIPKNSSKNEVFAKFQVNDQDLERGRAWVQVTTTTLADTGDDNLVSNTRNLNVPGLMYDLRSQEITFVEEGKVPVVCGKVIDSKFLLFHSTNIEMTEDCSLKTNDGLTPTEKNMATVILQVKDSVDANSVRLNSMPRHLKEF